MKGASQNLGAVRVAKWCYELEMSPLSTSVEDVRLMLQLISSELNHALEAHAQRARQAESS